MLVPRPALPLLILCLCAGTAAAQDLVSFRVSANINGPALAIDGEVYRRPATFLWPRGSKHVVSIVAGSLSQLGGNPSCSTDANSAVQYESDCRSRYSFSGWQNDKGSPVGSQVWTQSITVDGTSSALIAQFTAEYAIRVVQFDGPGSGPTGSCATKANRPFNPPGPGESIGVVFFGSLCFDYSGIAWVPPGVVDITALPMAGYALDGISWNGSPMGSLSKVTVTGPAALYVRFIAAKRVRFYTEPAGLKVRVDRADMSTVDQIHVNEIPPIPGLTDFVPGSTHNIGAPSPQLLNNTNWVFSEWSNGLKQDAVYVTGSDTLTTEVLTARFVPGVTTTFLTEPKGLRLSIDGRENWPNYGFVWGLGSTHTYTAPAEQLDANGRRWTFRGWKHSTAAAGQVTIDQTAIGSGSLVYTAVYESVPRLEIQSSVSGIRVDVDGTPCATPCRLDKPSGTELLISAPKLIAIDDSSRLEFTGWADSAGSPERAITVSGDVTLRANYGRYNRLQIISDPSDSANVRLSPPSADGFYDSSATVSVVLEPRPGFKFRRWEGDLTGTWPQGVLGMSGPRNVVAHLDKYPYVPEAGVTPAPGPTPADAVAPGSLIRISGASLTTDPQTGPTKPLTQTLAGITVQVGDWLLPMVSVAPDSITALLPSGAAPGDARLRYRNADGQEVTANFRIARNAPALFADSLRHEDGSPVTPDSPLQPGEYVTISGTGFGPHVLPVIDGFPAAESPANPVADPVTITLGDQTFSADSAIAEPGTSGRVRVRFRVPDSPSGDLFVTVANAVSNSVPTGPVTNTPHE